MIVTLITHGIPNKTSEQANCDPWLFAKSLEKRKIKINLICIWDRLLNTSNQSKNEQLRIFKRNFSNLNKLIIIIGKKKSYLERIHRFLLRIVSSSPHHFYGSAEITHKTINYLSILKAKKIICFFETPASILSTTNKKFEIYNYLGAYRKKVEKYRLKNLVKDNLILNILKIINTLTYIIKIDRVYRQIILKSKINFCPGNDTVTDLRKIGLKKLIYSKPLSKNLKKIKKKKTKIPNVLLIGNLKSTFMIDNLNELSNNLIQGLVKIRKKYPFNIRIVGKYLPNKHIKNKLNYKWIKFIGWVKNSDNEYAKAQYIFTPNTFSLSPRTKIIEAMSCGTIPLTYKENIDGIFQKMKNNENILISNNNNHFIRLFKNILKDKKKQKKVFINSKKLYNSYYNPDKILKKNLDIIFK